MERKIGEIFEFGGEWYQCLESSSCRCDCCDFGELGDCDIIACASGERKDGKEVHFKKLEKVGKPYEHYEKFYQCYKLPTEIEIRLLPNNCYPIGKDNLVEIEIKQTKKDMEEKKLNLKPFDLQKAREGKPVCIRDGRKARIVCFDRVDSKPILALVRSTDGKGEDVFDYFVSGKRLANALESDLDLMMLPEKREGWVNVYKERIYSTKEEAIEVIYDGATYIDTIKFSWEE